MINAVLLCVCLAANGPSVTLSGAVRDPAGQPIFIEATNQPGAMVVVAEGGPALRFQRRMSREGLPKAPRVLGSATANDAGNFTIGLPDEAPEIGWRRTRLTVWAYLPDFALQVRLIDRDWPRAGIPLSLTLPRAAPARLKLTDPDGRPLAGVRVRPRRVADQQVPEVIAEKLAAATDAEGLVIVDGPLASELDVVCIESDACGTQWAGVPRPQADEPTTIVVAPVGRLTGRLTADDLRGVRQRKLEFATWQVPGDESAGGGLAEVVTDGEGKFEVPVIAAGMLSFRIELGAEPVYLTSQNAGPQVDPLKTTQFEIPLRKGVSVTQEVHDHTGGAPIAGVRVSLEWGLNDDATGVSDDSGRVQVYMLPGSLTPMAIGIPPPFYYPQAIYPSEAAPEAQETVTLSPLRLARGMSVRGRLVDEEQRPISGAEVVGLWPLPQNGTTPVRAWTNRAGEFTIEGVPPEVSARLWFSHREAVTVEPTTVPAGGEPAVIVVGRKEGVSLEGRVVDAEGKPVEGAAVRLWAEQRYATTPFNDDNIELGSVLFEGTDLLKTNADGRFATPRWLRPNVRYSVEVDAPDMLRVQTEAIQPDTWHTTRFADVVLHPMPKLRSVNGRVVDSGGNPVAAAIVWQSGDGPRRFEAVTNEQGRFQIDGVYDGAAFLFARKDGFWLQGTCVADGAEGCQIVLQRTDEPARVMTTLPRILSLDEQREMAMSLVEPLLPMVRDPVFRSEHFQLLSIVERVDPPQALEIADAILTNPRIIAGVRQAAALTLFETDTDEAMAVVALLDQPHDRALAFLEAWDANRSETSKDEHKLLEEALIHARAEPDVGWKVYVLGRVAERWLNSGQRERGAAIVREAQALTEQLPAPTEATRRHTGVHMRGRFAGALARIDGPAAVSLIEGFEKPYRDWYLANVARGVAEHDAAEAERLFGMAEQENLRFGYGLAALHRMGAVDAERAARLARSYPQAVEQGYALGLVAHGLASADRAAAARLLDEAYRILEQARQTGQAKNGDYDPATAGAALLPVAERIDPSQLESFFWRSLSLRAPRPARGDPSWKQEARVANLATFLARYDRAVARVLIAPLAGRLREILAGAETQPWEIARPLLMALAAADPRWAYDLVQALPDAPVKATQSPKIIASRLLADYIGRSPRDLSRLLYAYSNLRDPEGSDEVP